MNKSTKIRMVGQGVISRNWNKDGIVTFTKTWHDHIIIYATAFINTT